MEQWRHELDLGGSGGEVILEDDLAFVQSSLPGGALLARNAVPENESKLNPSEPGDNKLNLLPEHEVHGAISILHGPSDESKGMILSPGFPLL